MQRMSSIGAVLLMAGEGLRFGGDIPKQFLMLAGKRVYLHTLDVFFRSKLFDEIVLVCSEEWTVEVQKEVGERARVVAGGKSRQESSYLGLKSLKTEIVVIHDAVRPFITEKILRENIEGALEFGAVDTCIPSADTLVQVKDNVIREIPNRAEFLRGQTPQSFRREWILEAHERANGTQATDDCRLVLEQGRPVQVVLGDEANIKITTELDLFIAEQLFRLRVGNRPFGKESLAGKVFAVVGGSGGIGGAICRKLELEGAKGIPLSRSSGLDLKKAASIQPIFKRLYEDWGPLDGLINCAGKLAVKPLIELSLEEIEELLAVNLQGLILCCQQARLKEGAHVVNIASSSFTRGRKDLGVYSGAKAGVVNFTQALAEERADLKVWTVVPQRTRTAMRQKAFPEENPDSLLDPEVVAEQVIEILKDPHSTGLLLDIKKELSH